MENENNLIQEEVKQVQYAGFWWRFLSHIIDNIIISFVSWIFILPILAIFGVSLYSLKQSGFDMDNMDVMLGPIIGAYVGIISSSVLINWLYYAIMESSKTQGTVGKLLLKIKVTDYDGQRISFGRATGRYFGKIISSFIFMIGYIMAGFTEKKQALHDMMAGCLVIKE